MLKAGNAPLAKPRGVCHAHKLTPRCANSRGHGRTVEEFDMRKRAINTSAHPVFEADRPALGPKTPDTLTRAAALRALGEVIYAARVGGYIKIGYTNNLWQRLHTLSADELLGFRPGTWDDEQRIHRELAVWAAKGREWYDPTPPVILVVNDMRRICNLEPLPFVDAA